MTENCVCCGSEIPEGAQVCSNCASKYSLTEVEKLKDMLRIMFNRCRDVWSFLGKDSDGIMCLHCGLRKECNEMHRRKGENQNG